MSTSAAAAPPGVLAGTPDDFLDFPRWWVPVVIGVIALIAGIAALVWPGPTLLVIGITFGIYLLFAGFGQLLDAFSPYLSTTVRVLSGILGVLTLFAGFVLMFRPAASVVVAALVLGFWFMITGCVQLATGFAVRESRAWNLIFGVIGIVAGFFILSQPGIGVVTLVYITSIALMVRGTVSIFFGFALKSASPRTGAAA